ncbi:MAG: hypothetical protein ACYSUI_14065, partial [Planctomycetota bacterium]
MCRSATVDRKSSIQLSRYPARTILAPMWSYNTSLNRQAWRVILLSLLPVGTAHGADPEPRAPLISPLDQRFLTRVVRRTMEQQLRDGTLYQTDYVPPTLRDIECQAIVTLRQHGHLRGVGSGGRGPVVTTCRDAA